MRGLRSFVMWLIILAAATTAAACDTGSGCIVIGVGTCNSPTPPLGYFAVGFPRAKIDYVAVTTAAGYRAGLKVGDTVTLQLVRDARGEIVTATDTIRTVTWALTDSSSARIVTQTDGSGWLVATRVGRIGLVQANGMQPRTYACTLVSGLRNCEMVGIIDVVP